MNPPHCSRVWLGVTLRWGGAAVFVVAAHIGCTALALKHWQDDEADDSAAGPVIIDQQHGRHGRR